jgi:hypothetical protein
MAPLGPQGTLALPKPFAMIVPIIGASPKPRPRGLAPLGKPRICYPSALTNNLNHGLNSLLKGEKVKYGIHSGESRLSFDSLAELNS